MPKVKKTSLKKSRKAEPTKASKVRPEDVPVPDDSDLEDTPRKKGVKSVKDVKDNGLSRGQRKRLQRRENFLRKFELAKVVQAQDKAKSGLDLSSLTDGLEEALVTSTPSERQRSLKRPGRKAQAANDEREMTHFQNVLNFQAFKSDPLGALEQHIKNSIKLQKEEEAKRKVKVKTPASIIKDKLKEKKRTRVNTNVKSVKGKFSKPKEERQREEEKQEERRRRKEEEKRRKREEKEKSKDSDEADAGRTDKVASGPGGLFKAVMKENETKRQHWGESVKGRVSSDYKGLTDAELERRFASPGGNASEKLMTEQEVLAMLRKGKDGKEKKK